MIIKDFGDVVKQITNHYGDEELTQYEKLYNRLKELVPNENLNNATLLIRVFKETDEDSILIDSFDENNAELNFDVSLKQDDEDILLSIASSSYADFLSYKVEEETIKKLSYPAMLAHSLWEITAYTFEDNI